VCVRAALAVIGCVEASSKGMVPQSAAAEDEPESYEDAIKRIRRTREEQVRKLNEQARKPDLRHGIERVKCLKCNRGPAPSR
jgi:hypothetical protein